MVRIGTIGRIGAAQPVSGRLARPASDPSASADAGATPPARALVVLDGGRRDGPSAAGRRAEAGFLAQLMVSADPALRASRLERTRNAAALYAETARRLA